MNADVLIGGAILLFVSVFVRIVPAFIRIEVSERTSRNLTDILPVAVFVNLAVYCVVSEVGQDAAAGAIGFALVSWLILIKRYNLLLGIAVASLCYMAVR